MAGFNKRLIITTFLGLTLTGCISFSHHITVEEPLHETLNKIKTELRVFKRDFNAANFQATCGDASQPLPLNIKKIKMSIDVANGNAVSGGIGATYDRESKKENKFEISLTPQNIPAQNDNKPRVKNGIADALYTVSEQLSMTSADEPCLLAGEAKYTTSFKLEKSSGAEYEFDILVFSADASGSKSKEFNNAIEVTFNFGDTPVLIVPVN